LVKCTLCGQLLVVNDVDEVAISWRVFALEALSLLCLGALGGIGIERNTAFLVVQVHGCRTLGESCVFVLLVTPSLDDIWRLTASLASRTPGPKLVTCPVKG
jgi:hypothetical protein